jgi:predicted XRE-type DNA-binding protein
MSDTTKVIPSSGNVFADMGRDDADELLIRVDLAISIATIIADRELTQTAAAKVLGIDQPKVSRLLRGDLYGFSIDQLIRLLGALGQRVSVTVEPVVGEPGGPGRKPSGRGKRAAKAA